MCRTALAFALAALACSGRTEVTVVNGSGGAGGGAAGLGGSGGGAGAGGGPAMFCPKAPGPKMVAVETPTGWFCIDSTEATEYHYADFLDASPLVEAQPPPCESNTSFEWWSKTPRSTKPRRNVDWCDARAYCQWAGKRLCGRLGGGSAPFEELASPTASEWYFACSRGGKRPYPYGLTFQDWACATADNPTTSGVSHVRGNWGCQGGFDELWDMSGNVAEWEDSCNGEGAIAKCRLRGGTAASLGEATRCQTDVSAFRSETEDQWGIRCCADAVPPG
jgi:sulfatase modifying factor 1